MISRLTSTVFALLITTFVHGQDRNTLLGVLNTYVDFTNASVSGINNTLPVLERYNDLLNSYERKGRLFGGEAPDSPKHPFLDEDMYDLGKDDPASLYKKCLAGAKVLSSAMQNDLNAHLKPMYECLGDIQGCLDSLNNLWSLSPRKVTTSDDGPYRFLRQAVSHIQRFHTHRNALMETFVSISSTTKSSGKNPTYLTSVSEINKGMVICEQIMQDMLNADTTQIGTYISSLNEVIENLNNGKSTYLKGIKSLGNRDGFDLHTLYDNIVSYFGVFVKRCNRFVSSNKYDYTYKFTKTEAYYTDLSAFFNFNGLADEYNNYVTLIGGGKLSILTDRGYRMQGWGYPETSLPVKPQLKWLKETPLFKIVYNR